MQRYEKEKHMIQQIFRSALLGTALGVLAASGAYAQGGGGELVVVANQEPQHMQAQVTYKEINSVGLRNVVEQLTRIDDNTGEVLPMLATSWKQVSPTVWHFKLREGITFHDGTPLDGEAAAVGINHAWSPDNDYDIRANMGPQITAEAVDESTVAVITAAPDPLLPKRMYLGGISSAKQILENPADYDLHPIGTGPYVFDEWKQGQYVTMKANPDWWGNTAADTYGEIYFDSVRIVWRSEPIVRAAMVQSGEAHVAMFLTPEECERFNATGGIKCKGKGSDTYLQFRLDYHDAHPLLTDLDFRKAVHTAIDWDGIRVNLMGLGQPLPGQMLPSVATGFHEGIQQYPYDPAGAKAIVEKLKASGADMPSIHIATRLGSTPRNGEMVEAMGAMLDAVGIPNTVAVEEPGVFNPWVTTKPNPKRSSAWLHPLGNPLMDNAANFGASFSCGGRISVFCDPDFDARVAIAATLSGDERHTALRDLVKEGHDRYVVTAVGLLERAYGLPENFEWDFGLDHRIVAVNMRLK